MTEAPVSAAYVRAMLCRVDLLHDLDDEVLDRLVEAVSVQDHEDGAVVLAQGDESASGLHLVFRGTATLERGGEAIAEIGPGTHLGELALLDGEPRMATVRAQHDLRTGFLTSGDFLDVVEENPSVALVLLASLASRFRFLEERLSATEARLAGTGD